MKRTFLLILASGTLACAGCADVSDGGELQSETVSKVVFSIEDSELSFAQTKTYISGSSHPWSSDDVVGIYPDTGGQVYFNIGEGYAGSTSAPFDGGGWEFKAGSTYYGYYPFIPEVYLDRHNIPVSFTGQRQRSKTGSDHIGQFSVLRTPGTTADNGSLHFVFKHLTAYYLLRISNLPAGTYSQVTVSAPSTLFVEKGHYDLMAESPAIVPEKFTSEMTILLDDFSVQPSETFDVYMALAPVDLSGKEITISMMDSKKKQYDFVKSISAAYVSGKIYGYLCNTWTEVPQTIGVGIGGWDNGEDEGGTCN